MKLYHHEGSWQLPGQQDKKAQRVIVPNSPIAFAAWLNARRVPLDGDVFDGLVPCNAAARELLGELREQEPPAPWKPRVEGFCDSCGRSAAGALKLKEGNEIDTIAQWMETAELWALQRLVERVREVVAERDQALGGKGVQ